VACARERRGTQVVRNRVLDLAVGEVQAQKRPTGVLLPVCDGEKPCLEEKVDVVPQRAPKRVDLEPVQLGHVVVLAQLLGQVLQARGHQQLQQPGGGPERWPEGAKLSLYKEVADAPRAEDGLGTAPAVTLALAIPLSCLPPSASS